VSQDWLCCFTHVTVGTVTTSAGNDSGTLRPLLSRQRILVLGSPGSGKSVLSARLAVLTGAPLVCLDDLYWERNWARRAHAEFVRAQQFVVDSDRWIIDGNYADTLAIRLARADAALFLDVSPTVCLFRVFRRGVARYFGERRSLPHRVREDADYRPSLSIDRRFVRKVARFRSETRPLMLAQIAASSAELIVMPSTRRDS
jgi:adenylate kinase family enzyme